MLVSSEIRMWVNDRCVTPHNVYEQCNIVDLGQNVPWDLRCVGLLDYGICVK